MFNLFSIVRTLRSCWKLLRRWLLTRRKEIIRCRKIVRKKGVLSLVRISIRFSISIKAKKISIILEPRLPVFRIFNRLITNLLRKNMNKKMKNMKLKKNLQVLVLSNLVLAPEVLVLNNLKEELKDWELNIPNYQANPNRLYHRLIFKSDIHMWKIKIVT